MELGSSDRGPGAGHAGRFHCGVHHGTMCGGAGHRGVHGGSPSMPLPPTTPIGTAVQGETPASPMGETATPSTEETLGTPEIRWATPLSQDENRRDVDTGLIRYRRMSCVMDATAEDAEYEYHESCLLSAEEPRDVEEALGDAPWKAAMVEEMRCIHENKTWELSDLPAGQKSIGLK